MEKLAWNPTLKKTVSWHPVPSLHSKQKKWKQWQILFYWAPKPLWEVTAAMKLRRLLLRRKAMTNLNSTLKSTDITRLPKVRIVKIMVFPVVMYRYESWTIKKPKHRRADALELCWRRLLSSLDSKEIKPVNPKGNQPWIFIGRTNAEAEAPITLATWCEELTQQKRPWGLKRLKAKGKGGRRRDGQTSSTNQWSWIWANSRRQQRTEEPGLHCPWDHRVWHNLAIEQLFPDI